MTHDRIANDPTGVGQPEYMAHDRIAHKIGVGQSIHMTHDSIANDSNWCWAT